MTSIKPFPLIATGIAICIALALIIPGVAKAILALLALCAIWATIECFRDRDTGPGLVFGAASLLIGFLAVVSK